MSLPLPSSLTPSKVSAFTECALAFRYATIDRLPEPSSLPAVRGTLVHRALELLMWEHDPGRRSVEAALACLDKAADELEHDPEFIGLALDPDGQASLLADAETLVRRYFTLEDPDQVHAVGVELLLEWRTGDLHLRGIIDRLDLDPDGGLVVTDYKTGRAPGQPYERRCLEGMRFYAFLCEQVLGRRPSRVQLLYLADPVAIVATPSEQSVRGLQRRTEALWTAIERACEAEDFRPKPSRVCEWCAFRAHCPAFGGEVLAFGAAGAEALAPAG